MARDPDQSNRPSDREFPESSGPSSTRQQHYRRLYETLPFGILLVERATLAIIDLNPYLRRLLGESPDGELPHDLTLDRIFDREGFRQVEAALRGSSDSLDLGPLTLLQRTDGSLRVQTSLQGYELDGQGFAELLFREAAPPLLDPVRGATGPPLSRSELLDQLPIGCQVIDRDWRYLYMNAEAARHGRSRVEEFIGRTMMECYPGIEATPLFERLSWCMEHREPVRMENEFTYPDGTRNLFELSIFPYADGIFVLSLDESARQRVDTVEARLAAIVESSDLAVIGKRLDGTITDWNLGAEALYGYTASEIIGRPISLIVPSEQQEELDEILRRIGSGERVRAHDTVRIRKDGSRVDVLLTVSPMIRMDGTIIGASAIATDITGRKNAERRARESSQLFETIATTIEDVFWMAEADSGSITYLSPAFEAIWGQTRKEFYDEPERFYETIHPDDRQRVRELFEYRGFERPFGLEYRIVRSDGIVRWIAHRGYPVRDREARIVRIVGVVQDRTAQVEAAERIREQAALLDVTSDVIVVTDFDHTIHFWNRSAEALFGIPREVAEGRNLNELVAAGENLSQMDEIFRIAAEEGQWEGELHPHRSDGTELTMDARLTVIRGEDGEPPAIMGVATDVTERRAIEHQLLRAQRMESLGALAGGIAHDLNNVLSPVIMGVDALLLQNPSDRSRRTLSIIRTSAERGAEIVGQILAFARGMDGTRVELQLKGILKEIESIVRETFPKSIQAVFSLDDDLWSIEGDPTQLHQVIMNMCVNARDAMPSGGRLRVTATNCELDQSYARMHLEATPGRYLLLEIADTGHGMAPETVEKIFDPFFTTKALGKGTGLGLSTVIAILKSHHGFVNVYSEVGSGTSFHVYLPARAASDTEAPHQETHRIERGNGEVILIVDDEEPIREITTDILETNGYGVVTATDGTEALVVYLQQQERIAAVLVDQMMPNLDGAATIRALRRINPELRIIAMSGLLSKQQSSALQELDVQGFLAKPFTAETLTVTLHRVLTTDFGLSAEA